MAGKATTNGLGRTTQGLQNLRMPLHLVCYPTTRGRIIRQRKRATICEVPKSKHSISLSRVQRGTTADCERTTGWPAKCKKESWATMVDTSLFRNTPGCQGPGSKASGYGTGHGHVYGVGDLAPRAEKSAEERSKAKFLDNYQKGTQSMKGSSTLKRAFDGAGGSLTKGPCRAAAGILRCGKHCAMPSSLAEISNVLKASGPRT